MPGNAFTDNLPADNAAVALRAAQLRAGAASTGGWPALKKRITWLLQPGAGSIPPVLGDLLALRRRRVGPSMGVALSNDPDPSRIIYAIFWPLPPPLPLPPRTSSPTPSSPTLRST